jgi:eukaryotic-like serine/threonine-protein kinase
MASSTQFRRIGPAGIARGGSIARFPSRIGSWELLQLVGEGLMSSLYQARAFGSSSLQAAGYAVKVLRPEWQDDSRGLAILAREAHVGRLVAHPHLVPILAAGLSAPPYWVAMPFLEGLSLAEQLRAARPLDLPVAIWIARQVTEALAALHQAGWMHGDVKPSNVVVSSSGHATLVDLGFARRSSERNAIVDRPILGTLHYIAPEVLYSAYGGDIRSDVYSLGVMLFQMFTGRLPFDADEVAELAALHRQEVPPDVRHLAPHLPTRAARLVQHMLSKEPLRRPLPEEIVERLASLEIETFAERRSSLPGDGEWISAAETALDN